MRKRLAVGMPICTARAVISTLGGLAVFGINGFILGPATAAMFISVGTSTSASAARRRIDVSGSTSVMAGSRGNLGALAHFATAPLQKLLETTRDRYAH